MPAAAVIPAPIAYIKVVAVKKLVVGSKDAGEHGPSEDPIEHRFSHPLLPASRLCH